MIKQHESYRDFADKRKICCLPNCNDVVSNFPFLMVGLYYILYVKTSMLLNIYYLICTGLILTSFGSAYYHLNPNSQTLFYDRLPMTLVMAGIISLQLDDYFGVDYYYTVLILSTSTCFYWKYSENLLPYLICQAFPILLYSFFSPVYNFTHQEYYTYSVFLYTLAKITELLDKKIYKHFICSGHTLKHAIAAISIMCILEMLNNRKLD